MSFRYWATGVADCWICFYCFLPTFVKKLQNSSVYLYLLVFSESMQALLFFILSINLLMNSHDFLAFFLYDVSILFVKRNFAFLLTLGFIIRILFYTGMIFGFIFTFTKQFLFGPLQILGALWTSMAHLHVFRRKL